MYSDSDDDYTEDGSFRYRMSRPDNVLIDRRDEIFAKNAAIDYMNRLKRDQGQNDEEPPVRSEKDNLRQWILHPENVPLRLDWRRFKVERAFQQMRGFHLGELDLVGRWPERYQGLHDKWQAYIADVAPLASSVKKQQVEHEFFDHAGGKFEKQIVTVPAYERDDLDAWDQLIMKWLCPTFTIQDCIARTYMTLETMAYYPLAKYQTLCLHHLPPEVLSVVFQEVSDVNSTRSLSATCRYLREVGLPYAMETRKLAMALPKKEAVVRTGTKAERRALLAVLMQQSRDKLLEDLQYLHARPDICKLVLTLTVENFWHTDNAFKLGIRQKSFPDPHKDPAFLEPVYSALARLIGRMKLESLTISNFALDTTLCARLLCQDRLTTIVLDECCATPSLRAFMTRHPNATFNATNVRALTMTIHDEVDDANFGSWCPLVLFSGLRVLSVNTSNERDGFCFPEPHIWRLCRAMNNIEVLHLQGFAPSEFPDLCRWVWHAASTGPLRLTHLKLATAYSVADREVCDFLRVLRHGNAPLRVLVLDGVEKGELQLFEVIAGLFPALEGLTVVRRASNRQMRSKLVEWDRPTHEYAAQLRELTKLRHFGANFFCHWSTTSPCALERLLELQQADPNVADSRPGDPDFRLEPLYFMDDGPAIALPFAAYCPSLETFAITSVDSTSYYRVDRSAAGGVRVEEIHSADFEQWDPLDPSQTWDPDDELWHD